MLEKKKEISGEWKCWKEREGGREGGRGKGEFCRGIIFFVIFFVLVE